MCMTLSAPIPECISRCCRAGPHRGDRLAGPDAVDHHAGRGEWPFHAVPRLAGKGFSSSADQHLTSLCIKYFYIDSLLVLGSSLLTQ